MLHSICQKIWKTQPGPQDWKKSGFIQSQRMVMTKNVQTLISYASKVMLKILHAWFQQHVNQDIPHVQVGFRKGRGTRDQIAKSFRS